MNGRMYFRNDQMEGKGNRKGSLESLRERERDAGAGGGGGGGVGGVGGVLKRTKHFVIQHGYKI